MKVVRRAAAARQPAVVRLAHLARSLALVGSVDVFEVASFWLPVNESTHIEAFLCLCLSGKRLRLSSENGSLDRLAPQSIHLMPPEVRPQDVRRFGPPSHSPPAEPTDSARSKGGHDDAAWFGNGRIENLTEVAHLGHVDRSGAVERMADQ